MAFIPTPSTPGQAALMAALLSIQQQLQQMCVSPKPSYGADGVSISWGEHFRNLVEMQAELRKQIQAEDGAWEVNQLPPGVPFSGW